MVLFNSKFNSVDIDSIYETDKPQDKSQDKPQDRSQDKPIEQPIEKNEGDINNDTLKFDRLLNNNVVNEDNIGIRLGNNDNVVNTVNEVNEDEDIKNDPILKDTIVSSKENVDWKEYLKLGFDFSYNHPYIVIGGLLVSYLTVKTLTSKKSTPQKIEKIEKKNEDIDIDVDMKKWLE